MKQIAGDAGAYVFVDESTGSRSQACRVSVLVSTHNLEMLIPLTIRSALAQDFTEYEVVIVDDASTDLSWHKVLEVVQAFVGFKGVRVKCLLNQRNLVIIGTFNRLMKESCGELCVVHCGDDVAHLDRVSKIVACWDKAKKQYPDLVSASSFAHRVRNFEDRDYVGVNVCPQYEVIPGVEVFNRDIPLLGAAAVYSRQMYDFFGPIDPQARYEDFSMHFRTQLYGLFMKVKEDLLEYHCVGGVSTSYRDSFIAIKKSASQHLHSFQQAYVDLKRCRGRLEKHNFEKFKNYVECNLHKYHVLVDLMSESFLVRLRACRKLLGLIKKDKRTLFWMVFVLPQSCANLIIKLRGFVGNAKRMLKARIGRG